MGFSIVGEANYSFPFTVPEGQWTHLAFVTPPPPPPTASKQQPPGSSGSSGGSRQHHAVQLFANGRLVGTVDLGSGTTPGGGGGLMLPKQYFGGTERALQGYMQEVGCSLSPSRQT